MKSSSSYLAGILLAFVSLNACAEKGEFWEVSSKMDMPGMPFAMPAQTSKVCIPKGGESDPRRTQDKDSKCTFTDVKHSGNTVKYKGTCVSGRGDTVNMTGETTYDSNSFKTKMQMTAENGKRQGESMNMAMTATGKRIGGSCDAEEIARKAQTQAQEQRRQVEIMQNDARAKACDVSNTGSLFASAAYYAGPSPMCSNKKEYCQAVRDTIQRDARAFEEVASQEEMRKRYAAQGVKKTEETSIINICNLDMASLKKGACKASVHKGPEHFMDKYCSPAEAKEYREYARKKQDCEGRGYTSGEKINACMAGKLAKEDSEHSCERDYTSADQRQACRNLAKCGSDVCDPAEDKVRKDAEKPKDSGKANSDTVLQGAKKLKGLLGF